MAGHDRRTPVRQKAILALAAAVALTGCTDQSLPYTAPAFGFLGKYAHDAPGAGVPVLLRNDAWWRGLDDPVLNRLIALAQTGNLSLDLARERVQAAQAARQGVPGRGLLSPSADVLASGTGGTGPDVAGSASLGLSWMLDPYGARRGELRASAARIEMAEAEIDAAHLLVLFNLANAYTALRSDQQGLRLARTALSRREDTLARTRTLQGAEQATRIDITRARARIADIRAELPGRQATIDASLAEIAVLTGTPPGTLPADLTRALMRDAAIPSPRLSPDVGIPADLLRNRPDIRIAERGYYAAVADIGVAQADLYPRLSLGGAITLNVLDGATPSAEYYFGPSIQFPGLPPTAARARVAARHSAAREAHIRWRSTVLNAILEVETALAAYRATGTALQSAREAARLHGQTLSLTREVFTSGEATLGELADIETALSQAERALNDLRRQYALRFIALNVRLGAGNDAPANDSKG